MASEREVEMNHMDLLKKFEEWKDWEVNVCGEMMSPQEASFLDDDLFVECAAQKTTHPMGTIWNDDYFDDNEEFTQRFIDWIKRAKGVEVDDVT